MKPLRASLVGAWLILVFGGVGPVGNQAKGGTYTFRTIAVSGGPFARLTQPAINNSGVVAFRASSDAEVWGVYTSDGGTITTIVDANGPFFAFGPQSINDSGTVAFPAILDDGSKSIVIGDGEITTTLYDTNGPFRDFNGHVAINNEGTVAFLGALDGGGIGIFKGNGGPTTTIVDSFGPFQALASPDINEGGMVVFAGSYHLETPPEIQGVFVGNGGSLTTIADNEGGSSSIIGSAYRINDDGVVAFVILGSGVFTGSGGPLTTIANSAGPFSEFNSSSSINSAGRVAFAAGLYAGGWGLFTGPDPVADKVIATGDPLDGSTVSRVWISPWGLNDDGYIAFYAELEDGREGVFVAVPEPSTLALLAVGAVSLAYGWRRRRCAA